MGMGTPGVMKSARTAKANCAEIFKDRRALGFVCSRFSSAVGDNWQCSSSEEPSNRHIYMPHWIIVPSFSFRYGAVAVVEFYLSGP